MWRENGQIKFFAISLNENGQGSQKTYVIDGSGNVIQQIDLYCAGQEIEILPVPGHCGYYYLIFNTEYVGLGGPGGTSFNEIYQNGLYLALLDFTTSSPTLVTLGSTQTNVSGFEKLLYLGFSTGLDAGTKGCDNGFAIGEPLEYVDQSNNTSTFYLPIYAMSNASSTSPYLHFLSYNFLEIASNSPIPTLVNSVGTEPAITNAQNSTVVINPYFNTYSEMELNKDGNLLCFSYGGSTKTLHLAYFTPPVINQYGYPSAPELIGNIQEGSEYANGKGIEFSPLTDANDGVVYFTFDNFSGTKGIKRLSFSLTNTSISSTGVNTVTSNTNYNVCDSYLELGQDGNIYVPGSSDMYKITPSNHSFSATGLNIATLLNNSPPPNSTDNVFVRMAPQQLDGLPYESYFSTLSGNCCLSATHHYEDEEWNGFSLSNQSTITVAGTIIVKNTVSFTNCNFYMRPNAKIVLENNAHLSFINCNVEACLDMWDGIYLDHTSEEITISHSSPFTKAIRHMINGVVLTNGAHYNFTNTRFKENNISYQIKDYTSTSTYPGSEVGVRITCLGTGIDRFPYTSLFPEYGILVQNVNTINLGGTSQQSSADKNKIYSCQKGINIENSNVSLNNFEMPFGNIIGVRAFTDGTEPEYSLTSTLGITTDFCDYGILIDGATKGIINVELESHTANRCSTAFKYQFNVGNEDHQGICNIKSCYYKDSWDAAVYTLLNEYIDINVLNSEVDNSTSYGWADGFIFQEGIFDSQDPFNVSMSTVNLKVTANVLYNVNTGIYLQCLKGAYIEDNLVYLSDFSPASGTREGGILANSLYNSYLNHNEIEMISNNPYNQLIGIAEDYGYYNQVREKTILFTETGLWFGGTYDRDNVVQCNVLGDNNCGLSLNYGTIGQQGLEDCAAADNQWIFTTSFQPFCHTKCVGLTQDPEYMYVRTDDLPYFPEENFSINGNGSYDNRIIWLEDCSPNNYCGNSQQMISQLEQIDLPDFGNTVEDTTSAIQNALMIYNELNSDTALLNNLDVQEQNFMDSMEYSDAVLLQKTIEFLNQDDSIAAGILLTSITPETTFETAWKRVIEIYSTNKLSKPNSSTMAELVTLANQPKLRLGKVSLAARTLVSVYEGRPKFIYIEDPDTIRFANGSYFARHINTQNSATLNANPCAIQVSPNPIESGTVLSVKTIQEVTLAIYSLQGVELEKFDLLKSDKHNLILDLPPGMYLIKAFTLEGELLSTTKLVVY